MCLFSALRTPLVGMWIYNDVSKWINDEVEGQTLDGLDNSRGVDCYYYFISLALNTHSLTFKVSFKVNVLSFCMKLILSELNFFLKNNIFFLIVCALKSTVWQPFTWGVGRCFVLMVFSVITGFSCNLSNLSSFSEGYWSGVLFSRF